MTHAVSTAAVAGTSIWQSMLGFEIPATEKILRTLAVYLGLAVIMRLAGKRQLAQLNSFDLLVILLLSNVVQNAVIGPDSSLTAGLLGAVVLVGFNSVELNREAENATYGELRQAVLDLQSHLDERLSALERRDSDRGSHGGDGVPG